MPALETRLKVFVLLLLFHYLQDFLLVPGAMDLCIKAGDANVKDVGVSLLPKAMDCHIPPVLHWDLGLPLLLSKLGPTRVYGRLCSTMKVSPHPLQCVGSLGGFHPFWRQMLSLNPSLDSIVLLSQSGMQGTAFPHHFGFVCCCTTFPDIILVRLVVELGLVQQGVHKLLTACEG
eukprot:7134714-Ditylum_brightwellii.AAC.1